MSPQLFIKDSWGWGVMLGLLVPTVLYALIIALLWVLGISRGLVYAENPQAPVLAGVAANLLLFRYLMVNRKVDKSGKAVLAITFVLTILVFAIT